MAFFDVVIPTFNRQKTIVRAIESVLSQTEGDFCLYVVNDGSTDDTLALLQKIRDPRLHASSTPNGGVSRARNHGVGLGRSPWLAFLDSDDEWLPHKLKIQRQRIENQPHVDFVHSEEIWIRKGQIVNTPIKYQKSNENIFERSCEQCLISPSTVAITRRLFESTGGFREDFPVCEDFDLWLKITSQNRIEFIEEPLIKKYGGHEDQLSMRFRAMDYWRVVSLRDQLSSGRLSESQSQAARSALRSKATVLLNGYRKHNNFSNYVEVKSAVEDFGVQT